MTEKSEGTVEILSQDTLLIRQYKKDFLKKTGRHLRIIACDKWENLCYFTENGDFETIVKLIHDFTGWIPEETFVPSRKKEGVFRRCIIDFICVNNGIAVNLCAKRTNRDHTTVLHSISSLETRLEYDYYTKKIVREIVGYLKDNYPGIIEEETEAISLLTNDEKVLVDSSLAGAVVAS